MSDFCLHQKSQMNGFFSLIPMAPIRVLSDKYFSSYDFLKIFLQKIQINFFYFFMILCWINKGVYLCLFEHANTRKHVYEHSCSSVRVFLSILAHLPYLVKSFLTLNVINTILAERNATPSE